jgi:hypothetical protein
MSGLIELVVLDHRAHCAVKDEDVQAQRISRLFLDV